MEPIHTLLDRQPPGPAPRLPEDLRALYGGELEIPGAAGARPYVIGNFVSTLDGVVSYGVPGKSGGGEISGANDADRFIMGLLRATADAVIVGSSTMSAAGRSHVWTAEFIYPPAAASFAHYRRDVLRKPPFPVTFIASATGEIDLNRAIFQNPDVHAVVLTTAEGEKRLVSAGIHRLPNSQVRAFQSAGSAVPPAAILDLLRREFNVGLLLHEGGPALFGSFVVEGLVDEFFLTVAPQLAGRTHESPRPGMIQGVEFLPQTAPWLNLIAVKQSGDHLYLRYRHRTSAR